MSMTARETRKDTYTVGAIDMDLRLLREVVMLPDGAGYNSTLVRGDETICEDPCLYI